MMNNYIRMFIFYALCVVESLVNFCCALFGYYPRCDFGTTFLVYGALFRVKKEIKSREANREDMNDEAAQKVALAKQLDHE